MFNSNCLTHDEISMQNDCMKMLLETIYVLYAHFTSNSIIITIIWAQKAGKTCSKIVQFKTRCFLVCTYLIDVRLAFLFVY